MRLKNWQVTTSMAVVFLMIGWLSKSCYDYISEVFYKAEQFDAGNCDPINAFSKKVQERSVSKTSN